MSATDILLAIALYFICWWTVLFAILPIGVRTQHDQGTRTPGTAESAPIAPLLFRKALATTVVAGVVFAFVYAVVFHGLVGLDDVPFLPRFDPPQTIAR